MGAFRNAVKRKTHKERGQPAARRRFGLLEKKKDFLQRAREFQKKEKTLQVLRRKAEDKNPDEFYFSMQNERTQGGVHVKPSAEANKYSQEELRLMKTQDLKYVALKAQTEGKKVERLRQRLHLLGAPAVSRHTVFVEDEAQLRGFSAAAHLDTPAELLGRTFNRPRASQLREPGAAPAAHGAEGEAAVHRGRASAYRELSERAERHSKLQGVALSMQHQKELMRDGSVKKTKPAEPGGQPTYKWRLQRKK